MSRTWVGVLAFAGGVAVGLVIAKLYVKATITGDVDSFLGHIGLGGGAVQAAVDSTVVPFLVN